MHLCAFRREKYFWSNNIFRNFISQFLICASLRHENPIVAQANHDTKLTVNAFQPYYWLMVFLFEIIEKSSLVLLLILEYQEELCCVN